MASEWQVTTATSDSLLTGSGETGHSAETGSAASQTHWAGQMGHYIPILFSSLKIFKYAEPWTNPIQKYLNINALSIYLIYV